MSQLDAKQLARMWKDETPSGTINGSNVTFTLSEVPVENDAIEIFLNGLYQEPGVDYSISGTTITMTTAPALGQSLKASYIQKQGGA